MSETSSSTITLRPLRSDEFDRLWAARVREAGGAWQPRPGDDQRAVLRRMIEHSGELHEGTLELGIEEGGHLVGEIQARCPKHGLPHGVFELGIVLFDEADRGRGLGGQAVALMTRRLFEEEDAHRVQASTDVGNAAMRRVLERLGFGFEGVLRGFMPVADGEPRDYAMYAVTRNDWETNDAWTHRS